MGLKLSEGPDAWRLEIEGLASWPKDGIQGQLYSESGKSGKIMFNPPFCREPVGEGTEALLARYGGSVFRFEKDLISGEVEPQVRQRYLERVGKFPKALPAQVLSPGKPIVVSLNGKEFAVGHSQKYVEDAVELTVFLDFKWRRLHEIGNARLTRVLLSLLDGLHALHAAGCLRGEINPSNFGVLGETVYFWDALGMDFPGFPCRTVYPDCVDPHQLKKDLRLLKHQPEAWELQAPYTRETDLYGFVVLLFTAFTGAGPWTGKHKQAKEKAELRGQRVRALLGIPVTSPDVVPDWIVPPEVMGERLLNHIHQVLQHGYRGPFPRALLSDLEWQVCSHCGLEFAGYFCPCGKGKRPFEPVSPAELAGARLRAIFERLNACKQAERK